MSTLLLRFAAPLQSWGTESKFETRRTEREPTKSAVIGMLAAAMGLKRNADLARFEEIRFGVRCDQEGEILKDFHMAHGTKDSYLTYRYYLSDAVFLVGLEHPDVKFLKQIEQALKAPAFPLYLGRRSCPPTQPLVLGVRDADLEKSLKEEAWQAAEWYQKKKEGEERKLRMVCDCLPHDSGAARVRDLPISFNPARREYAYRMAKEEFFTMPSENVQHDPMSEL